MKFEVYTKPLCPYCIKAKHALKKHGYEFTEYEVGKDCTKEDIQRRIDSLGLSVQVRTVPQIFANVDEYIGGYDDLKRKFNWE